jgi:site-specific DNA recombinase
MAEQKQFRCAVYTRKSSEEGLEQDFNSLEAQREACEAYVRSQSHEGWKLLPERFDDGGFSGGNMQRPGLEQLMHQVRAGKIDIIVIYKIDRLTRSLTDFARLAEVLDKHGVSFVSVTQQFNTTTSMGRLMLNVLLSFAQFEREITGERIRDKIAASKKKGMWMGGPTPMGYDVSGRTLVINDRDAAIIRRIFEGYLAAGDVPTLLQRLTAQAILTSRRTSAKGKHSGGRPFARGHLYKLLSNPIYIGRIPHKATSHPGQHPAIIERSLWDRVQAQLAANTQGTRTRRRRAKVEGSLLAGLLYTDAGNRMIVAHATKGARRYRYYVEEHPSGTVSTSEPVRLPAAEIETAAAAALRLLLADEREVLRQLSDLAPDQKGAALRQLRQLSDKLAQRGGKSLIEIARLLIAKVTYSRDALGLRISSDELRRLLGVGRPPSEWPRNADPGAENFVVTTPILYRRRGVQAKLVLPNSAQIQRPDRSLQQGVARARAWFEELATGKRRSIAEISAAEGITGSKVAALLDLAFLAPDLVERIVAGTQPATLSAAILVRDQVITLNWLAQRRNWAS